MSASDKNIVNFALSYKEHMNYKFSDIIILKHLAHSTIFQLLKTSWVSVHRLPL
jgi:hypothetical protein